MPVTIHVTGLKEIRERFKEFPAHYKVALKLALERSVLALWQKAGEYGYPPANPDSTYTRTGLLGRSLGIGEGGGTPNQPSIYDVQDTQASFGTNLEYAPYVVGDFDTEQAWMHQDRWWTIPQTLLTDSLDKIKESFEVMVDRLAAWLDRGQE
jgi:hypothetical protein